jgi:nucleotide-binding universal stress UspA family protein
MEKIILALDGDRQNTYAIDFACYLARLTDSRLTGVFLEGAPDGSGPATGTLEEFAGIACTSTGEPVNDPVLQQVSRFREACICREVPARVHRDRGIPLEELLLESRFADLIVVDPEMSFHKQERGAPTHFIRDIFPAAECPVMVSPYSFDGMERVIFAYDGSASSVFAIKQFTYLFPMFKKKKAVVVNVSKEKKPAIEEQYKMKEWLSAHYRDPEFVVLTGDASDELFGYLLEEKNAIVVLGAYGRGILSRYLKPSHANLLLRTINLPIFIAHK